MREWVIHDSIEHLRSIWYHWWHWCLCKSAFKSKDIIQYLHLVSASVVMLFMCVFSSVSVEEHTCPLSLCPRESVCPGRVMCGHSLLLQPCVRHTDDGSSAQEIFYLNAEENGLYHLPQWFHSSRLQKPCVPRRKHQLRRLFHQHEQSQKRRSEHVWIAAEGTGSKVTACRNKNQCQRIEYVEYMQVYMHMRILMFIWMHHTHQIYGIHIKMLNLLSVREEYFLFL